MQVELKFTKIDYFFYGIVCIMFYLIKELNIDALLKIISFCLLIRLSLWDLKFKAVPDNLLLLTYILFAISSYNEFIEFLKNSFIFMGGIFIFNEFVTYYIRNIKSKLTKNKNLEDIETSLGEGDIPIFGIIGGILGVELGILCVVLSAILSILGFFIYKEKELPMIPFLTFSTIIVFLLQDNIKFQIEKFIY